jgi:hypothetical protein
MHFCGHGSNQFRLQTTLSRVGRSRVERYCGSELLEFRPHAEAVLGMRIDMSDGDGYSTLVGVSVRRGDAVRFGR